MTQVKFLELIRRRLIIHGIAAKLTDREQDALRKWFTEAWNDGWISGVKSRAEFEKAKGDET